MRFVGGPTDKNYERRFKNPESRKRKKLIDENFEEYFTEKVVKGSIKMEIQKTLR